MTLAQAVHAAAAALAAGGNATPALDARLLAEAAAGLTREAMLLAGDTPLAPEQAAQLAVLVARRLAGEPVSRIRGQREFYGRAFTISPAVLDPRPETELVVDIALEQLAGVAAPVLLDLGTGSGALAVTLAAERPDARIVATDISADALAVAVRNAAAHGVATRCGFLRADWLGALAGRIDLLVANPPYIAAGEIGTLSPEVRAHDPLLALDGGADGLACYRALAAGLASGRLAPRRIAIEIGATQAAAIAAMFAAPGRVIGVRTDLAGLPRVITVDCAGS